MRQRELELIQVGLRYNINAFCYLNRILKGTQRITSFKPKEGGESILERPNSSSSITI